MKVITPADRRFREIASQTLAWIMENPVEHQKWLKENTSQLDTSFGKITIMASKFLKDDEVIIK